MDIFIGAENIVSPLGITVEENFTSLLSNRSGIQLCKERGFNKEDVYLSVADAAPGNAYHNFLNRCITGIRALLTADVLKDKNTLLILSTAKGDLDAGLSTAISGLPDILTREYSLANAPLMISNACISGVLAINTAADCIKAGHYETVVVIGCDVVTDFVLYGFQSLFALSPEPCAPYDAGRKGINLGEGCGGVVLSARKDIYSNTPLRYLGGASANDANHISGPSRTGEGLVRAVTRALEYAGADTCEIDFISAHGTGTLYNDEMEAIAFGRLKMSHLPLNSLKGYYGHTLGAAGIIETAVGMQSLRNNMLIKSLGFKTQGTSAELCIIEKNIPTEANVFLKTASGFGGGNAALMISKK